MKKITCFLCLLLLIVSVFTMMSSCDNNGNAEEACIHSWTEATCTAPKTCSLCHETEGKALGHTFTDKNVIKEPTCFEAGSKTVICSVCNYEKNETISVTAHYPEKLQKHEAKAATHTENGNYEYYFCELCDKKFADIEATDVFAENEEIILAMGHGRIEQIPSVEPTCTESGNILYYYCSVCDKNYNGRSFDAKELTDITVPPAGHKDAVLVAEVAATHTEDGNIQYYHCDACEKNYAGKEAAASELTNLIVTAAGHNGALKIDKKDATCTEEGNIEYYFCEPCSKKLDGTSANSKVLSDSEITLPANGHTYVEGVCHCGELDHEHTAATTVKVPAVSATHTSQGNIEYYTCNRCIVIINAEGEEITMAETAVPAIGHTDALHFPAVSAKHTENGNIEYYFCEPCDKNYDGTAADAEIIENVITPATGHTDALLVPAAEATHTAPGNMAYYRCGVCEKNYNGTAADAEIIENVTTDPATGHIGATKVEATRATHTVNGNIEYYHCEACGKNYDGTSANAEWIPDGQEVFFAMGHGRDIEPFYEVAPTCTEPGHITYYYCKTCKKNYDNGKSPLANELTDEEIIIPATGLHKTEFVETAMPTHTEDGIIEHYKCTECNRLFEDEAAAVEYAPEDITMPASGHYNAQKVPAKESTGTDVGNIEYYNCPTCGKNYDGTGPDAKEIPFGEEIIPAKGSSL